MVDLLSPADTERLHVADYVIVDVQNIVDYTTAHFADEDVELS